METMQQGNAFRRDMKMRRGTEAATATAAGCPSIRRRVTLRKEKATHRGTNHTNAAEGQTVTTAWMKRCVFSMHRSARAQSQKPPKARQLCMPHLHSTMPSRSATTPHLSISLCSQTAGCSAYQRLLRYRLHRSAPHAPRLAPSTAAEARRRDP